MIKCITVFDGKADLEAVVRQAPKAARPERLALCTVRNPREIAALALSWHPDREAVNSFFGARPTTIAEERVAGGEAWLADRWERHRDQSTLVLVGFIQRVAHMSREEFGSYWWDRHRPLADRVVPEHLNPSAYVHNYVVPDDRSRWDGIGELYEQSLPVARQRGEWFLSDAATPLIDDEERFMNRVTREVLVTDQEIIIG